MPSDTIVVVGSSNMDMVVHTDHIPVPGETLLSGSFFMNPGGKGANQAVAAARLGGDVTFISKLGNDLFGQQFAQLLATEHINTAFLLSDEQLPSGVALITVDQHGENSIVVAPGANAALLPPDIEAAKELIASAAVLLMQLETPLETVRSLTSFAAAQGVRVILNPAPAAILEPALLSNVHILVPNATEAELLSGAPVRNIDEAKRAAKVICDQGTDIVIITLGSMGALIYRQGACEVISVQPVKAVDTTAAGDVFCGALAVALCEEQPLAQAVQFACKAAAISVTRHGAQASVPYRYELGGA